MIGRVFIMGAIAGVGALLLVPGVAAAVSRAARPMARKAGKAGAKAYDEARRAGAEAYEHFEDLAAEIRADIDVEQTGDGWDETASSPANGTESAAAQPTQSGANRPG